MEGRIYKLWCSAKGDEIARYVNYAEGGVV